MPVTPKPDSELQPWIEGDWESAAWLPAHAENRKIKDGALVLFSEVPGLENLWDKWLAAWQIWKREALRWKKSQDLFNLLFDQQQAVERSSLRKIAMAGNMFFMTDKAHQGVCFPLLAQPVVIQTGTLKQGTKTRSVIRVRLNSEETPNLRTGIFNALPDEPFNQKAIGDISKAVQTKIPHPFSVESVRPEFEAFALGLCPPNSRWASSMAQCRLTEAEPFWVCEEPVIWVQDRPFDLGEVARSTAKRVLDGASIPEHMFDLVCAPEENEGRAAVLYEEDREKTVEEDLAEAGGESAHILFAKPANREQLRIAERIEGGTGVLVQGPPGTGKTHTIANLIGHFLSEGKTVLVTSQKEKALTVLKEKIPEPLQPLCVSSLAGSGDVQRTIADLIARVDKESVFSLEKRVSGIRTERDEIQKELSEVRKQLLFLLGRERKQFKLGDTLYTYSQLGGWLRQHQDLGNCLPASDCDFSQAFPLSPDELADLYARCRAVKPEDEAKISAGLPERNSIPEPSLVQETLKQREKEKALQETLVVETEPLNGLEGVSGFGFSNEKIRMTFANTSSALPQGLVQDVERFNEASHKQNQDWLWEAREAGSRPETLALKRWKKLLEVLENVYGLASRMVLDESTAEVVIPSSSDPVEVMNAANHFADDGIDEPNFFQRLFLRKADCQAVEGVTIGGHPPKSVDDYRKIVTFIEYREKLPELKSLWSNLVTRNGGPELKEPDSGDSVIQAKEEWGSKIESALSWWKDEARPLLRKLHDQGIRIEMRSELGNIGPHEVSEALNEMFPKAVLWVRSRGQAKKVEEEISRISSLLASGAEQFPAVCRPLKDCFEREDVTGYAKNYEELVRLWGEGESVEKLHSDLSRLKSVSPVWASKLSARDENLLRAGAPENVSEAWAWGEKNAFFEKYRNETPEEVEKRAEELSNRLRKSTAELSSSLAWLNLKERLTRKASLLQALKGWAQVVRSIGKGMGKNVHAKREKARSLMDRCQAAVPVWIMPLENALRTFSGKEPFDVVILDEASQSDVTALPVLFLGKKVVVAGDKEQVSPEAIGVDQERAEDVRQRDLDGRVVNSEAYQPTMSLYDIAELTYQPVMLVEHFRCVPKIIGFSNSLSYDGRIQPLRNSESTNLVPPFALCRTDGIREDVRNQKEADTIAALIKACIRQPEYNGKKFGVISMLSGGNANRSQATLIRHTVIRAIGAEAFEKYDILCGTSAEFQGDERDVIFMSLVDSSPEDGGLIRTLGMGRDDMYKKRWNVAVSRAKDQIWVVYSFDPSRDLSDGDIRKTFFNYIENSDELDLQKKRVEEEAESEFEKAVGEALTNRGYRLTPQYKVGPYRIDFVVSGDEKKAALECDGDQFHGSPEAVAHDLGRQTVLERIGWKFVRVSGGEYYRDPESAINRICEALSKLGVNPVPENKSIDNVQEKSDLERRIKEEADGFLKALEKDPLEGTDTALDSSSSSGFPDISVNAAAYGNLMRNRAVETVTGTVVKEASGKDGEVLRSEGKELSTAGEQTDFFEELNENNFVSGRVSDGLGRPASSDKVNRMPWENTSSE